MSAVTSCPGEVELRKLVEGILSGPEQASVTEHVESCPDCQTALERVSGGGGWAERISEKLSQREESADQTLQDAVNRLVDRLRNDRVSAATILEGVSLADTKLDFLQPSDKPGVLGTLGPHEITEVIGRGGMGVVLKGFDPRLNRFVAVKVLAPETAGNPTARRRFLREAQAAAAISHDHVVTIHAVDESERLPYLVMEYVSGLSLHELLDRKGALELKQILRIGMQTASGLAAAHAQGLVHRDIKPANILLENGVQRVKITDFGLARAVDDVGITQTGVVTGTPLFMSPEQARGEAIDHRTDLFSLGSVLYTMCTGRAPFRAETTMGVLRRVCEDTPRPIQEVNPEIPEWLCAIVERLLEKNPDERFQSAAEVAEQLGGWLAYLQQPASAARPVTIAPRKRPWTLRKAARMVVGGVGEMVLGIVTLCAMVAVITLVRGYFFEDRDVESPATVENGIPTPDVSPPRETGEATASPGEPGLLQATLSNDARTAKVTSLAVSPGGWWVAAGYEDGAIDVWDIPAKRVIASWQISSNPVRAVAFSADGRWLACAHEKTGGSWVVRLSPVRIARDKPLSVGFAGAFELPVEGLGVRSIAFSPDSNLVIAGTGDDTSGELHVWNTTNRTQVARHAGFGSAVQSLTMMPDGAVLAVLAGGSSKAIDLDSGKVELEVNFSMTLPKSPAAALPNVPMTFAFAPPNVGLVASGENQGNVRLFALKSSEQRLFRAHDTAIAAVALSPDGRLLATAARASEVKVWDVSRLQSAPAAAAQAATEKNAPEDEPLSAARLIEMLGDRAERIVEYAYRPNWSPDGRSILFTHSDETELRIVGRESREVRTLVRAADYFTDSGVVDGVWSPDGKRVAFVQRPKTRREDRLQREEICVVNADGTGVRRLASGGYPSWSADSTRVYFQDRHRNMLRSIEVGRENAEPQDVIACGGYYPVVSPNEKYVAFGVANELTITALGTKEILSTWKAPVPLSGLIVGWSPDSQELSIGGYTSEWIGFWIYDLQKQRAERVWNAPVSEGAWSADGNRFAFVVRGANPELWIAELDGESTADALRTLVATTFEGATSQQATAQNSAGIREITLADRIFTGEHAGGEFGIYSVAVTPDGRRALTGHFGGPVCLWDVDTGTQQRCFEAHTDTVHSVAISADGRYGLSGSEDSSIRLWDLQAGEEVRRFEGHTARVHSVAFSPGGEFILSGSADFGLKEDNTVRLWNRHTGEEVRRFPGRIGFIQHVAFSPGGELAATADGMFGQILLWNVQTGHLVHRFNGLPSHATDMAFTPDGRFLVSGHIAREQQGGRWRDPENCVLRVWDLKSGRLTAEMKGHSGSIVAVAISPDGRHVLSASSGWHDAEGRFLRTDDQTIRLWELASGREVRRFLPTERVLDLAFLPDGGAFLSAGDDSLRLWKLPQDLKRDRARAD